MPVITDIIQQKKNKKFYSIYIDGEFRFSLAENDLNYLDLKKDQNISQDKLDFLIQEYALQKARSYAYFLISKKAYSEKSLIEKLSSKNYPQDIIKKIIAELKEYDYINDKNLIYEYSKIKIDQKPMGRYRLQNELFNKQFDEKLIKECIERIYNEYNEKELALRAVKMRFKNMPENPDEKLLKTVNNFLLNRGFSYEIITDVLSDIKKKHNE